MCDICLSSPCLPGCPNAPDPPSIGECEHCHYPVYVGDNYADIDGELYCEDCLNNFSTDEWLDLLGASLKEAEPYEPEYEYDD